MKVLLINGSPHKEGCTHTALQEIMDTLSKNGIESEEFNLGTKNINDCVACGYCYKEHKCVFDDEVNRIAERLDEFDAIVIGAPVYYSGPSARLCALMDRLCYSSGRKLRGKLAAAVASCRRGGATASFERLNQYFLMTNMFVVGSQYWNIIHGFTAEEAKKDAEGLQTMRTLANNMTYMLRCMEAGKKAGIEMLPREKTTMTSFMDGK